MSRQLTTALSALAAGVMLMTAVPASAAPAIGTLTINGTQHVNPRGCVRVSPQPIVLRIANRTDQPAIVFRARTCGGPRVGVIPVGGERVIAGASVRIAGVRPTSSRPPTGRQG